MVEKQLIINNRTINYKGIFLIDDIFNSINQSLTKLGYEKQEKKTEERVLPSGKSSYIELRPFKEKTSYVTLMIKIKINLNQVTEVVKEIQLYKRKFMQGEVVINFDAWSITDYENRWGMKPWAFFMKSLINKYFYPLPLESGFTGELVSDTNQISGNLQSLFKSYQNLESGTNSNKNIKLP